MLYSSQMILFYKAYLTDIKSSFRGGDDADDITKSLLKLCRMLVSEGEDSPWNRWIFHFRSQLETDNSPISYTLLKKKNFQILPLLGQLLQQDWQVSFSAGWDKDKDKDNCLPTWSKAGKRSLLLEEEREVNAKERRSVTREETLDSWNYHKTIISCGKWKL